MDARYAIIQNDFMGGSLVRRSTGMFGILMDDGKDTIVGNESTVHALAAFMEAQDNGEQTDDSKRSDEKQGTSEDRVVSAETLPAEADVDATPAKQADTATAAKADVKEDVKAAVEKSSTK